MFSKCIYYIIGGDCMYRDIDIFNNEINFSCMGCDIANNKMIPPGGYVYQDDLINVSADPLIPIIGFMVLGINRHINSLNQMSEDELFRVIKILNKTVTIVKEVCNIETVTIIQEEESNHYHIWVLPNYDWMKQFGKGCIGIKEKIEYSKKNNDEVTKENILNTINQIKTKFNDL